MNVHYCYRYGIYAHDTYISVNSESFLSLEMSDLYSVKIHVTRGEGSNIAYPATEHILLLPLTFMEQYGERCDTSPTLFCLFLNQNKY